MDIRITFRRGKLTDGFRDRALERTRKLTKFEPRLIAVELLFDEDHGKVVAEARADVPGVPALIARADADSHRKALDQVVSRLSRQLKKERSKRVDHQAPPAALQVT